MVAKRRGEASTYIAKVKTFGKGHLNQNFEGCFRSVTNNQCQYINGQSRKQICISVTFQNSRVGSVNSFSSKGNIEVFANNTDSGESARNELSHLKSELFAL